MKKLLIALGVSAAVVSGSAMAAEVPFNTETRVNARATGKVTASTCQYSPPAPSGFVEVALGNHEQNTLNRDGKTEAVDFNFTFTNCPANVSNGKSGLKLWGDDTHLIVENAAEGLLKNDFTGSMKAQNVFVQILDGKGNVFKFGKTNAVEEDFRKDNNGTIKFDFKARLSAPNNDASSGEVLSYAPFIVEYK